MSTHENTHAPGPRQAAGEPVSAHFPPLLNVVVGLSHRNGQVDLLRARGDGILAIVHECTRGKEFTDPFYVRNRRAAQDVGLLWGARHSGTGGDGMAQADRFLATAEPGPHDLLVLGLKQNPRGPSMTLEEARTFVARVAAATGRWPGLCAGHYLKKLLGASADPCLGDCWLWLSQYDPAPEVPPGWKTWTLWQYTDGVLGPPPHEVDGIGRCDRNVHSGSVQALGSLWGF